MAHVRSCLLSVLAGLLCLGSSAKQIGKFYLDDPIQTGPRPVPVGNIVKLEIYEPYDYLYQSSRQAPRESRPALGTNTLGEVPDSEWFTNRHGRTRMTIDALKRGAGNENAPQPPFEIVGAKTEGISPGFRMRDAKGRLYFVKMDGLTNPELGTGAEVVGSKFFHAIGYFTPENYIIRIGKSDWSIEKGAQLTWAHRIVGELAAQDLFDIIATVPHLPDGSFRAIASLAIPGKGLGPFRYEGNRSDDPNDIIPHQDRRDLRGLYVFCAWLNHTDAKAANTDNALVREEGISFVRHYLLDFGSTLGSDGDCAKDSRFGNQYQIPAANLAFKSLLSFGLYSPGWERAYYPNLKAAGRIESNVFEPEKWKTNIPNPAFLSRRPDDEYWAAKIVLAFTDEDIRALVETGEYSDPRVVDYLATTLAQRRDKIGRTYFSKVLPLDSFRVLNGELLFEDLAVRYKFRPALDYRASWSQFDNGSGALTPLPGETSFHLPSRFSSLSEGDYLAVTIHDLGDEHKTVMVYLRKNGPTAEAVGIERTWK